MPAVALGMLTRAVRTLGPLRASGRSRGGSGLVCAPQPGGPGSRSGESPSPAAASRSRRRRQTRPALVSGIRPHDRGLDVGRAARFGGGPRALSRDRSGTSRRGRARLDGGAAAFRQLGHGRERGPRPRFASEHRDGTGRLTRHHRDGCALARTQGARDLHRAAVGARIVSRPAPRTDGGADARCPRGRDRPSSCPFAGVRFGAAPCPPGWPR